MNRWTLTSGGLARGSEATGPAHRGTTGRAAAALALLLLAGGCAAEPKRDAASTPPAQTAAPAMSQVERGKYLVTILMCNDCHTPFKMGPNGPEPDMTLMLSGHPAGLVMPPPPKVDMPWMMIGAATNTAFAGPWGISYAINLTPHPVSGLAEVWTEGLFITAMRTGKHLGTSRMIMPPMPWPGYGQMTDDDLKAVFAYLKSIPPIDNEVPDAVEAPAPTMPAH